jgi:hypothetical protein
LYRVYDEFGLEGRQVVGLDKQHCLYTIDSSDLLAEASRMFLGARDASNPRHYAIYTSGTCVDIISVREPKFELLDMGGASDA